MERLGSSTFYLRRRHKKKKKKIIIRSSGKYKATFTLTLLIKM